MSSLTRVVLQTDSGTLDAILCGTHSELNSALMLKEIQRVLVTGGIYLAISYGDPPNRIPLFEKAHLSFDVKCLVIQYPREHSRDSESVSREGDSELSQTYEVDEEVGHK